MSKSRPAPSAIGAKEKLGGLESLMRRHLAGRGDLNVGEALRVLNEAQVLLSSAPSQSAPREGVGLTANESAVIAAAVQLTPLLEEGWDEYDLPEDQNAGSKACDALVAAVNKMLKNEPASVASSTRQIEPPYGWWSFVRSVMAQGATIMQDYTAGNHKSYEEYSARLDAAARERTEEIEAVLRTASATEESKK